MATKVHARECAFNFIFKGFHPIPLVDKIIKLGGN